MSVRSTSPPSSARWTKPLSWCGGVTNIRPRLTDALIARAAQIQLRDAIDGPDAPITIDRDVALLNGVEQHVAFSTERRRTLAVPSAASAGDVGAMVAA